VDLRRNARASQWKSGDHPDESGGLYTNRPGPARYQHTNEGLRDVNLDFPYDFDPRGRTAETDYDPHIRDLIEQVLFTAPGERVNRPDFGSGLLRLVFAPNSDELAATTQYLVQGSLQQFLGDLIQVDAVEVENQDATLRVSVRYVVLRTQTLETAEFTKGAPTG
jgi:phage baseplate assembly protein W